MKAVLVRKEEAEAVRQRLFLEDAVDKERKLVKRNGFVEIPVRGYYVANDLTLVEQENPQFYFPKKTLDEILDIPECEKKTLAFWMAGSWGYYHRISQRRA